MMSDEWINKYKPSSISDLVVNINSVKSIQNWLNSYELSKRKMLKMKKEKKVKKNKLDMVVDEKSCMLVTGNHGFGKTVSVNVILKEMGYVVHNLDIKTLKMYKDVDEIMNKYIIKQDIISLLKESDVKKNALVIDQLESITLATEKSCIINLQKGNDIKWYCPIIFISNNHHNKLLTEIKKLSFNVKFFDPRLNDMKLIFNKIAMNESMKFYDDAAIGKLIMHSQNDIRQMIFFLQGINTVHHDQVITFEMIRKYCQNTNVRDIDIDLFKAISTLLNEYEDINKCIKLYETEKVLLPLMMQQNYITHICENHENNKHEMVKNIAASLSLGDITENHIYGEQNWNMQDVHGIFACAIPSYYLHTGNKEDASPVTPKFAMDLNRTSIRSINKKNIVNADIFLKNMNVIDYTYIDKIICSLINKGKIEDCVKLLSDYGLQLEYVESLLKIDKIKDEKVLLTNKQKKEFANFIEKYKNI